MTATPLSSRQRTLLELLAAGGTLRWAIYRCEWHWILNGVPVDGRTVNSLVQRKLVRWPLDDIVRLTDRGRAAVETP